SGSSRSARSISVPRISDASRAFASDPVTRTMRIGRLSRGCPARSEPPGIERGDLLPELFGRAGVLDDVVGQGPRLGRAKLRGRTPSELLFRDAADRGPLSS